MKTKNRFVPCPHCKRLFEINHEPKKSDTVTCPHCEGEVNLYKRGR